ncbi:MAG TPA: MMPL family transporter, partial [Thermoanaerobaculia bacterium]|nr:MMPL family transporter [Thermoanaerobaculia bacterium]
MNALSRAAIRHPGRVLAAAALLACAALPGLARLELRTDGQALVPGQAPAVEYDREIRRAFGVRDSMVAVVRTDRPEGIFNPATLRLVRDLTAAFQEMKGMGPADVTSLATETGFRFRPGTLRRASLLEPLPETPAALAELRRDVQRIGLYEGILVSRDSGSAAIVLGVPPEVDRRAFHRRVQEIASAHASGSGRVEVLGAPVAETLLGSHILADLGVPPSWLGAETGDAGRGPGLVPLCLGVMALVFLIGFRRPAAALLPLLKVGVCLAVLFGLMGWLGVPVYLTTAVLPVILMAVGMAGEVHLFRRYGALHRESPEAGSAALARGAVEEVQKPVFQAAATTVIGFLSFSLSPLGPVRAFGLFAAAGVLLCLLWSLTVTPAFLALVPPGWVVRRGGGLRERWNPFGALAAATVRRRRAVLVLAALAALVSLDGVRRLTVQDSWMDGFAPESAFARGMRRFDEQFSGAHVLLVTMEADPYRLSGALTAEAMGDRRLELPLAAARGIAAARLQGSLVEIAAVGPTPLKWSSWVESASVEEDRLVLSWPVTGGSPKFWLRPRPGERVAYEVWLEPLVVPATLRRIGDLERFLETRPGVGGVLGPVRFLETAHFMIQPDNPESRRLPANLEETRILWRNSRVVRGEERLRRLVDDDHARALVTVFLKDSNYAATRRLMEEVREYERRFLAPQGVRLGFAGDVAVSQALIGAVVSTQVGSLALSLLGIFAMTAWLARSPRRGFYCVLPVGLAVLLNFAVMGWLSIPLGVATAMFAGMTLGVGVDSALHLLARFDRLRDQGLDRGTAVSGALAATGPAILLDTLSVTLGFAALLLSQVPANHRLGGLLALS